MVLGMIPGAAAAGMSLTVGDKVLYGKYSGEAVEDGKLTEGAWQTNIALSGGDKAASNNPALAEPFKMINPAKPAVAFEFDVRIDKSPVFKQEYTTLWQKETCPGLYFVVGGKNFNTVGDSANTSSAGMSFGLTYTEQGILNNVPFTNATEQATRAQTAQMLTNYLRGN